MGTQQVLLIVLAVIIVGVAVAVGITMFSTQSASSNREALRADLLNFAAQALAFYKTPAGMAGGGNGSPGFGANTAEAKRTVGRWLGLDANGQFTNDNAFYHMYHLYDKDRIIIAAWGNEKGQNPSYTNWSDPGATRRGNVACYIQIFPQLTPINRMGTWN
ncbi:MAG: hypothetical protein KAW92_11985 [Candidatus Cloacimonetes bacterium]|nr:hypothetical protein [Candidatus Cloacimonadota bacterium]